MVRIVKVFQILSSEILHCFTYIPCTGDEVFEIYEDEVSHNNNFEKDRWFFDKNDDFKNNDKDFFLMFDMF